MIVETGPAVDISDEPVHPYTQRLVDAILRPDPGAGITRRTEDGRSRREGVTADGGCPFVDVCPIRVDICATVRPALREREGRKVACHVETSPAPRPMERASRPRSRRPVCSPAWRWAEVALRPSSSEPTTCTASTISTMPTERRSTPASRTPSPSPA
ncbi:MAG: hypothetical protein R2715_06700 [Ilumatobacteraceae bacterium]